MKPRHILIQLVFMLFFIFPVIGSTELNRGIIDAVKLTDADMPQGFTYGNLPEFAKRVLKTNPSMMDTGAIRKLAGQVYPNGDYRHIEAMHVSIIANKKKPYGDDIVCYIFLFRDMKGAKSEIEKLNSYIEFNRDRAILMSRENCAVLIFVDDVANFPHIQRMAGRMERSLKN